MGLRRHVRKESHSAAHFPNMLFVSEDFERPIECQSALSAVRLD